MPTAQPLGVFVTRMDVLTTSQAPTYDALRSVMWRALRDELATESPSKVAGIHWAGTGPRVVRKLREGFSSGGSVYVVGVLVADDPSVFANFSAYERQTMLGIVASSIDNTWRSTLRTGMSIVTTILPYNEGQNGPLSFWDPAPPAPAANTRTRDRFPQTSITGTPGPEQNENPYGPDSLAPGVSQPNNLGSPQDWTALVKAIGVTAGILGGVWLLFSLSSAYKSAKEAKGTYDSVRGLVRSNPTELGGHARIQRLMKAYVTRTTRGHWVYEPNSAIPIGSGVWSFYMRHRDSPRGTDGSVRRGTATHRELERMGS